MPDPIVPPASTAPGHTDQSIPPITIPVGNGKSIVVGGSFLGVIFAGASFFYHAHAEAMGKIASLDAKVTALQQSMSEWKQTTAEQRNEMRAEIKELNQAVNTLTRSLKVGGLSSVAPVPGVPLVIGAPECPGDIAGLL